MPNYVQFKLNWIWLGLMRPSKTAIISKIDDNVPKNFNYVFICFFENHLKVMRNTFYFMLIDLFDLEIFTFLALPFVYVKKRLHKKA